MEGIYKMHIDCGRMGSLESVFIADEAATNWLISSGIQVYFGEVLGKHSEVYTAITERDLKLVTTEENVVKLFEKHGLESGFNPFNYRSLNAESFLSEDEVDDDMTVMDVYNKINKA